MLVDNDANKTNKDLVPTNITITNFTGEATDTWGILPLAVSLGTKTITISFFVVDTTSTYNTLLGRDWIHDSKCIP